MQIKTTLDLQLRSSVLKKRTEYKHEDIFQQAKKNSND